jgi:hypothetical protein
MSTWPNRGASGGPCGGWNNESPSSQKKSDHTGLTQANRPPRNPVWVSPPATVDGIAVCRDVRADVG